MLFLLPNTSCQAFNKKLQGMLKSEKKNKSKMRRQASEPDLGMAEILELRDGEFKITIVNMLRVLIEKVNM